MSSYITISGLANEIWDDLNSPTSLSTTSVENKLFSSGYLGGFDILINSNHYVGYDYINSGNCLVPEINGQEQAIYKQKYLTDFYLKQSTSLFAFEGGRTSETWTSIKEEGSQIVRSSVGEISKYWNTQYQNSLKQLDYLLDQYKRNASSPVSVDYLTIENPSGS